MRTQSPNFPERLWRVNHTTQPEIIDMGKRKLTAAELAAYRELARAAAKLRRAQERAEKTQDSRQSDNRRAVQRTQGVARDA